MATPSPGSKTAVPGEHQAHDDDAGHRLDAAVQAEPQQGDVAEYRRRIAEVRNGRYLLNGHHKLAAYEAEPVRPLLIELTLQSRRRCPATRWATGGTGHAASHQIGPSW